ncbi:MAG: CcmD family protein [Chitinophagaceae bacterium]
MNKFNPFSGLLLLFCLLESSPLLAQTTDNQPTMATLMRSNGKIYVVVAVLLVIFISIILYLFRLERKINRLEKQYPPSS